MQKEFIGIGSIKNLSQILDEVKPSKVLLVTGNKSYEASGAKNKIDQLLGGIDSHRYYGFEENPKFDELLQGAKVVQDYKPDLIIAVGGGSVLDTAKIISILPTDIDTATKVITGEHKEFDKIAPIVAIPTTSGSGSEATHFAVAYINKDKYSVADSVILPDYVILDSELTHTMLPYQTAVSGMDAFCQAIESYWATSSTTESRKYAFEAMHIIKENIEAAVHNPCSKVRDNMAKGSFYAGKAINITKTTAPHALSYSLSTNYNLPHGHAVSLTIGAFIELNYKVALSIEDQVLLEKMKTIFDLFGVTNGTDCRKSFYQFIKGLGLATTLTEIGLVNKSDIADLVGEVNIERLHNHPFLPSKNQLIELLEGLMD